MRGREELKREPVLTLWLLCLLAPNVQKSGAKQVIVKGPGTTAKSRMDGDRRKREEGGKGQFILEREIGQWTHLQFVFLIFKVGGREWEHTGENALMKQSPSKKDQILPPLLPVDVLTKMLFCALNYLCFSGKH